MELLKLEDNHGENKEVWSFTHHRLTEEEKPILSHLLLDSEIKTLNLDGNIEFGSSGAMELSKVLPKTKISSLNFASNYLGEEGIKAISNVLPDCPYLTSLVISNCHVNRSAIETLAVALPKCNLIELDISGHFFEKDELIILASGFNEPNRLTSLNIRLCRAKPSAIAEFVKILPKSNLTYLNLSDNEIRLEGAKALAEVLPRTLIRNLDLRSCRIGDEGVIELFQVLPECKNLQILNLKINNLQDSAARKLGEVLGRNSTLEKLSLSGNYINSDGAVAIAQGLCENKTLKEFKLSSNGIGEFGFMSLAWIVPQTGLTKLDLGDNVESKPRDDELVANLQRRPKDNELQIFASDLGPNGFQILVQTLPSKKLTCLKLNFVPLKTPERLDYISQILIKCDTLLKLELSGCELGDEGIVVISPLLPKTNLNSIHLSVNSIGPVGAKALAEVLPQTHITNIDLSNNNFGSEGTKYLAEALPKSRVSQLIYGTNQIGGEGAIELAKSLRQTKITLLHINSNEISSEGFSKLAEALPGSQVSNLGIVTNNINPDTLTSLAPIFKFPSQLSNLVMGDEEFGNEGVIKLMKYVQDEDCQITALNIGFVDFNMDGVTALANALPKTKIKFLGLMGGNLKDDGMKILSPILPKTNIESLELGYNEITAEGAEILASYLPDTKLKELLMSSNKIGDKGGVALAKVLPNTSITKLELYNCNIYDEGANALVEAMKHMFSNFEISYGYYVSTLSDLQKNHLKLNQLLNDDHSRDESFISELEKLAILHIYQPMLLNEPTLEKPKRLLIKAANLGSVQAVFILGNLYLNEFQNPTKAKEYYEKAANLGHGISKLCLQIMNNKSQRQQAEEGLLKIDNFTINLPKTHDHATFQRLENERNQQVLELSEKNALVSKTGISLAALNRLSEIEPVYYVFTAMKDYEKQGHLNFSKGQIVYIKYARMKEFARFNKEGLPTCYIPYNRDNNGNLRKNVGYIPYEIYLSHLKEKPRSQWNAEDICNAIILPTTSSSSSTYVDLLPDQDRGKPFEGHILSYARSSIFSELVNCLNERFKDQDPTKIFLWVDLIGINQNEWLKTKSEDIGKILEVNLTQLFRLMSDRRLIYFDKAQPTNLQRSWCLVELLSCLKAQEETIAKIEICMTSQIKTEIFAQDLSLLLNTIDTSKAQCFNSADKVAIDLQIKKSLREKGEEDISMEIAFSRLNNIVKGWLVATFLPQNVF